MPRILDRVLRRIFDLLVAVGVLILLAPLFVLCAIFNKLLSPGPIFYKARRVGRNETVFDMYKFRSMIINADSIGIALTAYEDQRITPIGRFLRRWKLDEVPQFVNVLKGQMSIVGPRPEAPDYVFHYTDQQKQVMSVRPGITGPAQFAHRYEEQMLKGQIDPEKFYLSQIMPKKIAIDLKYIQKRTIATDMWWLFKTVFGLLARPTNQSVINEKG